MAERKRRKKGEMSELDRLRLELKADIELIAIRQGSMAQQVEHLTDQLEGRVDQQAEQIRTMVERLEDLARQMQELGRAMQLNSRDTARLGREVAAGQRWMEGRMRLLGQRFDAILAAVHADTSADHDLLMELRERVERLEQQGRPPAA